MKTFKLTVTEEELKALIDYQTSMHAKGDYEIERSYRIHDLTKRLNKKDNEPEETNETNKQPENQTSPIAGWQ